MLTCICSLLRQCIFSPYIIPCSLLLFFHLTCDVFCFPLSSGLRIAVNVLSLSFQAGFVGEFVLTCFFFYFFVIWSYLSFELIPKLKQRSPLAEPFYGTICLYNRERREKLSEDFVFRMLPAEMQNVSCRNFYVSS